MLTLPSVLLLATVVSAFYDSHCCCGCPYPCEINIPSRCGASPTTPCSQKESFNQSELLSPCELIIKLHDLTISVTRDTVEEHNGQPVPIGRDKKRPNSVTVADSSSASKDNNMPSIFSQLFSFPRGLFANIGRGEVVKNETKTINGTLIKETVRKFPNGTETTKIMLQNETDPVKSKQKWREIMGSVHHGIGQMDDGFTTMQHGLVDSFDSLFKGVVDGLFNILRAR